MIALDTNVLVRFLTRDDPGEAEAAGTLIGGLSDDEPGFVCREVLVELVWVLERSYRIGRHDIVGAIEGLLSSAEIVVETNGDVAHSLPLYEAEGQGFADLMIRAASKRAGASRLVTFDRKLAQLEGVDLIHGGGRR